MTHARQQHRRLIATVVFTSLLLGLIALALGATNPGIAAAAIVSVAALAAMFHFLLPGGSFFSAVFANSIGIYACIYVFFVDENFSQAGGTWQTVGFLLPLLGFLAGVMWRRGQIIQAVESTEKPLERKLWYAALWILPLMAVAAATFVAPINSFEPQEQDAALFVAMTIIALTATLATRDIAAFLLVTALLFEDFFTNVAHLARPAFAFFTCYSLITIVFGCLYTILDRYSGSPNFLIYGNLRPITLPESLYLSVVTLSTVGYGDISASSALARMMVAAEILLGVLMLLFGVQAILTSKKS